MPTTTTFTTTPGSNDGRQYFQDTEISPATLASGALQRRFDPLRYPGSGTKNVFPPTVTTVVASATSEAQTLTEGGTGLTSFTVTFGAQTTTSLLAAATAVQVQAALVALSSIGAGNVAVTGADGGPYTVSFIGTLANTNVAAMTTTPTGGTGTVVVASAGGVAGATEVVITGTYFERGAVVTVSGSGVTVTNTRLSADQHTIRATFTVASGAASTARDVIVTNPDTGAVTSAGTFTVS